jgi:hypothetical protein
MSTRKFTELDPSASVAGTDIFAITKSGAAVSTRVTAAQIGDHVKTSQSLEDTTELNARDAANQRYVQRMAISNFPYALDARGLRVRHVGSGRFLTVDEANGGRYSLDGIVWNSSSYPANAWVSGAVGLPNGDVLACGFDTGTDRGALYLSTNNGATFTKVVGAEGDTAAARGHFRDIATDGAGLCALAAGDVIWTYDGATLTKRFTPPTTGGILLRSVGFGLIGGQPAFLSGGRVDVAKHRWVYALVSGLGTWTEIGGTGDGVASSAMWHDFHYSAVDDAWYGVGGEGSGGYIARLASSVFTVDGSPAGALHTNGWIYGITEAPAGELLLTSNDGLFAGPFGDMRKVPARIVGTGLRGIAFNGRRAVATWAAANASFASLATH